MADRKTILDLAPDDKSIKAAEGLADANKWQTLGKTEHLIWGLFQGSGAHPYETQVNLATANFECSCPSRKLPCKHSLALGLIHADTIGSFNDAPAPPWLNITAPQERPEQGFPNLPKSWEDALGNELEQPYMQTLADFLKEERATHTIYPKHEDVFNALELTAYDDAKVLILGQDPYHGEGQAHGLSFSVKDGVAVPPSLRNMFKELESDLDFEIPESGFLQPWAEQGILMLNAVLTVRQGQANSHKNKGWEQFTDKIIESLNEKDSPVIFVLWGNYAQKKLKLIDENKHYVIKSAHPSPLSAHNGFFGSKPFSKINEILENLGSDPIDWELEDMPF